MGPKCADSCHAGRPQAAILWFHRAMSPPPEIDDFAPLEANCSIRTTAAPKARDSSFAVTLGIGPVDGILAVPVFGPERWAESLRFDTMPSSSSSPQTLRWRVLNPRPGEAQTSDPGYVVGCTGREA